MMPVLKPEIPAVPDKQTKVDFEKKLTLFIYDDNDEPYSRPHTTTKKQPKSILKSKKTKIRIKNTDVNLESLAMYNVSPYDAQLHKEPVVNVRTLNHKTIYSWNRVASLLSKHGFVPKKDDEENIASVVSIYTPA